MNTISGQIVDVRSGRIYSGTLFIDEGRIVRIEEGPVSESNIIIPGFIDAHVHVESSMLIPTEFARLAVLHGTVATISDPHEIGNVLGTSGVEFMIRNGKKTNFKFHFGAPPCVPATVFETAGATIDSTEIKRLLEMPEVCYLAEVLNYPGVLYDDPELMAKIQAAKDAGKPIDGHAPGLRGDDARKYISAGISTDHECVSYDEAKEKISYGMKIIIREGSAAKNFDALIPLLDEYPEQVMFCTDDSHPNTLRKGHINILARRAVARGCNLMNVLRAGSMNAVDHYKLNVGLLQPGDPADFCVVDNLEQFNVTQTFIAGVCVASEGESFLKNIHEEPLNNFNCQPISPEQLKVKSSGSDVNVIGVDDGQLVTFKMTARLADSSGYFESDTDQDILKIVVVNRYFDAPPAVAFTHHFGLKRGAIASSVAHDSHNIVAVGVSDEDISRAINLLIEHKGGISLVDGSQEELIPLPFAGIMTGADAFETADVYDKLQNLVRGMGTKLYDPFMALSFCALLVIPKIKLSDKGLFDAESFKFMSIYCTEPTAASQETTANEFRRE